MSVKVTTEVAEVEASKAPLDEQGQVQKRAHRNAVVDVLLMWLVVLMPVAGGGRWRYFILLPMLHSLLFGLPGSPLNMSRQPLCSNIRLSDPSRPFFVA